MNSRKIAIIALGKRNAGKSNTWYQLFGKTIRSGLKKLRINNKELLTFVRNSSFEESGDEIENYFDVYVVNSSPEESGYEIEDYFEENNLPNMIFCSVQYVEHGIKTIDWFKKNNYFLYIQWLNPGFKDTSEYDDYLGFEKRFSSAGIFSKRSGKEMTLRVAEIRRFLENLR